MLARFEHDNARRFLLNWHTSPANDVWSIRRAGLMLECGLKDQADHLLTDTSNQLSATREGTEIDFAHRSAEGLALNLLWSCSHLRYLNTTKYTDQKKSKVDDFYIQDDDPLSRSSYISTPKLETGSVPEEEVKFPRNSGRCVKVWAAN